MSKPPYINNSEEWSDLFSCEVLEQTATTKLVQITPGPKCQNPHGFLHGGIQSLLIDELTMKYLYVALPNYRFLTVRMDITYIKPIRINPFILSIEIGKIDLTNNRGDATISLYSLSNNLLSTAHFEFALYIKKELNETKS